MTELPIACTLTADGMIARIALIDASPPTACSTARGPTPGCVCGCSTAPTSSSAPVSS